MLGSGNNKYNLIFFFRFWYMLSDGHGIIVQRALKIPSNILRILVVVLTKQHELTQPRCLWDIPGKLLLVWCNQVADNANAIFQNTVAALFLHTDADESEDLMRVKICVWAIQEKRFRTKFVKLNCLKLMYFFANLVDEFLEAIRLTWRLEPVDDSCIALQNLDRKIYEISNCDPKKPRKNWNFQGGASPKKIWVQKLIEFWTKFWF